VRIASLLQSKGTFVATIGPSQKRRMPRTTFAVGPVSLKKERIPPPSPRFSTETA